MKCPICQKDAKTRQGMVKHLTGTARYGGHDLDPAEAVRRAAEVFEVRGAFAGTALEQEPRLAASPELSQEQRTSFLYAVLLRLVENKEMPKYQFERAIDGFLGAFLPGILERKLGGEVELVAQEFPLRKAGGFQSTNVDYVLLRRDGSSFTWVFVELKTDPRSVREEQNAIYTERFTRKTTMEELLRDVAAIKQVSTQPWKYEELLGRFRGLPVDCTVELVYLSPVKHQLPTVEVPFRSITFDELAELDLHDHDAEWSLFQALVLPQLRPSDR